MLRLLAREAYNRDLDLAQRIQYVHTYLLAKIWYTSQVLPVPSVQIRQIETAVAWFIWQRGHLSYTPLYTAKKKKKRGWDLTDKETNCRALLLYRTWMKIRRGEEIRAEWLSYWSLKSQRGNPSHVEGIPRNLEHLRLYARDKAYVEPPKQGESPRTCRTRIYGTLRRINLAANPPINVHITKRYPTTNWGRLWATVIRHGQRMQSRQIGSKSSTTSCPQFRDYMPSGLRASASAPIVGSTVVMYRITQCGEGKKIWEWTMNRIAWILRMDPVWIPNEWAIRLQFNIWPPQWHRAVLLILAHLVWWTREGWTLSAQEYFDFVRRRRWKVNHNTRRATQVGNYLIILD
jgi:hypothetical protein